MYYSKPVTIYVLELLNGKYYLGKTMDLNTQLRKHFGYDELCRFHQCGNTWLERWRPVRIHKLYRRSRDSDLDRLTLEYMVKYGIDNVRGGMYSSNVLSLSHREKIRKDTQPVLIKPISNRRDIKLL
tara:strand:+ start:184 stop:564 length:381 start_codon:yes stop_codon:yes gene_type:complete